MTTSRTTWTFHVVDSLTAVFADGLERSSGDPKHDVSPLIAIPGEIVSAQVAYQPPTTPSFLLSDGMRARIEVPSGLDVHAYAVDLVPCDLPAYEDHDDGYVRPDPGLFPDVLRPLPTTDDGQGHLTVEGIPAVLGQWRSLWLDVRVRDDDGVDIERDAALTVTLYDPAGEALGTVIQPVRCARRALPPLSIAHTEWIHLDGIAAYYDHDVFGPEHRRVCERILEAAVEMGVNTVLTPVWTPPLDTAVGARRQPTQLVGIREVPPCHADNAKVPQTTRNAPSGEVDPARAMEAAHTSPQVAVDSVRYEFDFSLLRWWVEMCRRLGITTLEMPHLFTQWGATACPSFLIDSGNGPEPAFGWDVPATDPSYRNLLKQLLPALINELTDCWDPRRIIFHVSDEPGAWARQGYQAARGVVTDLLRGFRTADAVSEVDMLEVLDLPVIATDHADAFLSHPRLADQRNDFWLYYCMAQSKDVSNRFFAQPRPRHRAIGVQLWSTGAAGFLHWGFNFYNTQLSRRSTDPFRDTTAGAAFPGGDTFVVYPGEGGQIWRSVRHRVLADAFVDHRLLTAVQAQLDPEEFARLLGPFADIDLRRYPVDGRAYHDLRARLIAAWDAVD
ncbi:DUF4091 domain-containing protein [Devriesea agamarum]|uniref:DUF4091 domain-containing protein n=1 Tax=Devriesea agamarum TaxID=472569 RepID=UPI00071CF3E2|nr:DUF4091 domain-containing protein [Devriesea agamarum]